MDSRRLLLLSSSQLHGHEFLQYAREEITSFLKEKAVSSVLFIPYAGFDYEEYLNLISKPMKDFGFDVKSIHTYESPEQAVNCAKAIFVGGGNTFKLLKTLYEHNLINIIRKRVFQEGLPYIGSSAGTVVASISMCTTNDMPIVYPPSFDAIALLPFNINPHYLEPDPNSTHKGETRDDRINEYHKISGTPPVLGLREGNILHLHCGQLTLKGLMKAKLFISGKKPVEYEQGSDLTFLLK